MDSTLTRKHITDFMRNNKTYLGIEKPYSDLFVSKLLEDAAFDMLCCLFREYDRLLESKNKRPTLLDSVPPLEIPKELERYTYYSPKPGTPYPVENDFSKNWASIPKPVVVGCPFENVPEKKKYKNKDAVQGRDQNLLMNLSRAQGKYDSDDDYLKGG